MRRFVFASLACALAVAPSCSDGGSGPVSTTLTLARYEGNGQTGLQGFALNIRPAVIVRDAQSVPKAGVTVNFTVQSGGGSVQNGSAVSDPTGVARVGNWIIQSGANTLQAVVAPPDSGGSITFTATGVAPTFNIVIQFLTTMTASQTNAFNQAKTRWEQIIFQDIPNVTLSTPAAAGACGSNSPAIPAGTPFDDVHIFASIVPIDGPGGTAGSASFCGFRNVGQLPFIGTMRFDSADVGTLEALGLLDDVIMHEMGHVLGSGGLWSRKNFLVDSGTVDPYFRGAAARVKFDDLGGLAYVGDKVPVENTGGAGTADHHWRESVLNTELMTGTVNAGQPNPLSAVTSASMQDLGYMVNHAATDAYTVPAAASASASALQSGRVVIHLGDDILRVPVMVVDSRGRVVRIIQP